MDNAAKQAHRMAKQANFQAPPPYSTSAGDFYQAPPDVYQPAYNCGFPLPTTVFPEPPPAGFIYATSAPPPYPGLATAPENYAPFQPPQQQQQPPYAMPQAAGGYPTTAGSTYPTTFYQNGYVPSYQPTPPYANNAPPYAPSYGQASAGPAPAGFNANVVPPSYDEATKKNN